MEKLPIEYHPAARLELLDTLEWYSERSREAAVRFHRQIERAQEAIKRTPNLWAEYLYGTRRYLLKRFEYVVVYRVLADRIQLVAIAHGRRKPGYWVDRLSSSE